MSLKLISRTVALALLTSASVALPQRLPGRNDNGRFGDPTAAPRIYDDYFYGVIKKIDKNQLVLEKTRFGVDQTVKLDSKTKIIRDGKPTSLDQLKIGQGVYVQTKKDKKTGELLAKKVVAGAGATEAP